MLHQHVGQQQRERLVADQFARAPHGVAEPERLLLPGEARRAGHRQILIEIFERLVLLPIAQRHFQFELAVEMILDDAFVAAGDEDEMLDAGRARLVDDMLDQRPVDHRQHFLRHGFGGRQEPGTEAGDGENGFTDGLHAVPEAGEGAGDTLYCQNDRPMSRIEYDPARRIRWTLPNGGGDNLLLVIRQTLTVTPVPSMRP